MRMALLLLTLAAPAFAAEPVAPPPANGGLKAITVDGLDWVGDLAAALEQAAKDKKPVFIDFTGETCVNCKLNEKNVFAKEDVKNLFKKYVRVQLYTDVIPEAYYKTAPNEEKREDDAAVNQKFQKATFKSEALPLYVVVRPVDGGKFEVVGKYDEGKINNVEKFVEFLQAPLK